MWMVTLLLSAFAQECPETERWPAPQWEDATEATSTDRKASISALESYAFGEVDWDDKDRAGIRTEGVVIIHDGQLVYERYANDYGTGRKHLTWSVTKTFTNVLAGMAIHQGLVTENDSICTQLDGIEGENCDITIANLLEFSSGLRWAETYEGGSPTNSSVLAMLYGEGRSDMARFVATQPREVPPGTAWRYSSGDTTLLAAVIGKAMSPLHGDNWPWTALFDPIGMERVTFERDQAGTYVGSSWLWAPPREMAKLGYLLLNDGCWAGERLVPEGWVAGSTTASEPIRTKSLTPSDGSVNGRQIWLNTPVPEIGQTKRPWPDVPENAYAALGHWSQSIFVAPDQRTVVVRVGDDRDGTWSWNTFFSLALAVVEDPS